jgi:hydrogenase expression/formation protein HypD
MNVDKNIANIRRLAASIARPIRLMEVCGTHTMAAFRSGLRSLLPENLSLLSGPGCPVCVTPNEFIDRAIAIAKQSGATMATFGDMVKVPGSESSLEVARAEGARVLVVYSPSDALNEARRSKSTKVVFLGVGFETTAPAVAWTIKEAAEAGVDNYSVLCAHKTMPFAMAALLRGGEVKIDGFICPGHVSVIIGPGAYEFICREHKIPCVVTGFEAADMAIAIEMLLAQIADGRAEVENEYHRSVREGGNAQARAAMVEVFEECETGWRGLGSIARSGLKIREKYSAHDAAKIFPGLKLPRPVENPGCICADVIRGARTPLECGLFRKRCTPTTPVGACMVSSEGTCHIYYKYAERAK